MNFNEVDQARKLLGLGEVATLKEIKSAYRRLAHSHHPDKHGSASDAGEMMEKLNRAYKVLMDYCNDYRYTFREEDVARTYPYEEYLRRYNSAWFDGI